jgi:hypothetical protein
MLKYMKYMLLRKKSKISMGIDAMIMELSLLDAQAQCPGPDGYLVMCGL